MDQDPGARAAYLSLVEPNGVYHALDNAVEVRVGEDDERRLAAQLQRELLAAPRGRGPDDSPHLGRAGEGDLVDIRVRHQSGSGASVARNDVHHPGRQSDFLAQLGKPQRRE
jgi:hypothetical protein